MHSHPIPLGVTCQWGLRRDCLPNLMWLLKMSFSPRRKMRGKSSLFFSLALRIQMRPGWSDSEGMQKVSTDGTPPPMYLASQESHPMHVVPWAGPGCSSILEEMHRSWPSGFPRHLGGCSKLKAPRRNVERGIKLVASHGLRPAALRG